MFSQLFDRSSPFGQNTCRIENDGDSRICRKEGSVSFSSLISYNALYDISGKPLQ